MSQVTMPTSGGSLRESPVAAPPNRTQPQARERRAWYPLALIFAIVALGIVVAGTFSYRTYERHFRTGIEHQLSAITELKVGQIVQWRGERLADATFVRRTPYAARRALEVLAKPASQTTRQMFTDWLKALFAGGSYEQALLLDDQLKVGLVYPARTSNVLSDVTLRAAQQALRSKEVVLTDPHREREDGPIYLSLMVPLVVRTEGSGERVPAAGKASSPADRSAGLLVLQINARQQFYPLIQHWPTPSRTAEILLVRRDGKDALLLNELRFQTNTALKLRVPVESTNRASVKAVLGQEGIVDASDYRGVPVVAALRAIPNSPWSLVARMELAEMYAPLRERLWMTVLLMGALLLGAGASVGLVWRQQRVGYYRERHEAAEALIASEVRYRSLFDNMLEGFAHCQMIFEQGRPHDFIYLHVNNAFERLTGLQDVTGRRVTEVIPGIRETDPEVLEIYGRVAAGGPPEKFESYVRALEMWFSVSVYCPAPGYFVAAFDVITARKEAEEQVRRLHEELQRHAADLERRVNERTAQLEAANKELEAFSYSVSHDLRAPLRAIEGLTRILAETHAARLDDEGQRLMRIIGAETKRMGQLIDDLLAFSRTSRGPMRSEKIDMTALAREVFAECAAPAANRKIRLKLDTLQPACGDPSLIRQVLANLLSNALKYTGRKPEAEIELGSRVEGNESRYWIKDNGVGFDPKYAGKLFGIFQRLHREDQFEGTGVGLALVQRIILRHGGRVWAEGRLNEGATFHFTLRHNGSNNDECVRTPKNRMKVGRMLRGEDSRASRLMSRERRSKWPESVSPQSPAA
jgi:signal transduction histidine kinase